MTRRDDCSCFTYRLYAPCLELSLKSLKTTATSRETRYKSSSVVNLTLHRRKRVSFEKTKVSFIFVHGGNFEHCSLRDFPRGGVHRLRAITRHLTTCHVTENSLRFHKMADVCILFSDRLQYFVARSCVTVSSNIREFPLKFVEF